MGELVQLSEKREYTEADREAAYHAWRASGRSLRKLSDLLGISKSTIGTWSQTERWIDRARQEDLNEASDVRLSIVGIITSQVTESLATIVEIRDDPKAPHRDRFNAASFLLGIAGISPAVKTQSTVTITDQTEATEQLSELADKSVNELMAVEATYRTKR